MSEILDKRFIQAGDDMLDLDPLGSPPQIEAGPRPATTIEDLPPAPVVVRGWAFVGGGEGHRVGGAVRAGLGAVRHGWAGDLTSRQGRGPTPPACFYMPVF